MTLTMFVNSLKLNSGMVDHFSKSMEAAPDEAAAVRPLTTHHKNYQS